MIHDMVLLVLLEADVSSSTAHCCLLEQLARDLRQEAGNTLPLCDPELTCLLETPRKCAAHLHGTEVALLRRELERKSHPPLRRVHGSESDVLPVLVELDAPSEERVDRLQNLTRLDAEDLGSATQQEDSSGVGKGTVLLTSFKRMRRLACAASSSDFSFTSRS